MHQFLIVDQNDAETSLHQPFSKYCSNYQIIHPKTASAFAAAGPELLPNNALMGLLQKSKSIIHMLYDHDTGVLIAEYQHYVHPFHVAVQVLVSCHAHIRHLFPIPFQWCNDHKQSCWQHPPFC